MRSLTARGPFDSLPFYIFELFFSLRICALSPRWSSRSCPHMGSPSSLFLFYMLPRNTFLGLNLPAVYAHFWPPTLMNHNGTNRFTPFFSKNNYLIYFWDFSPKIPQSPPNVRKIRYLLLKIRYFLQKNERNRFTTAVPVRNGEPVRAVVVHMCRNFINIRLSLR